MSALAPKVEPVDAQARAAAGAAQRHGGNDDLGVAAQGCGRAVGGVAAQKEQPAPLHDGVAGGLPR